MGILEQMAGEEPVPRSAHITVRLNEDIVKRLDTLAAEDRISRSLLVRRMLLTGIYQREALPSGS